MRSIIGGVMLLVVGVGGWLLGSFYPAPPQVQALVGRGADDLRLQAEHIDWGVLLQTLSPEQVEALKTEASKAAAAAGEAILVESVREADYAETETTAMPAIPGTAAVPPAAASQGVFESGLALCLRMTVTNAPKPVEYAPFVNANGVRLAVNPTQGACLSSGFGARGGGSHKGVDYHSDTGGPIVAAADGVVIERKYRDDYGNMLLIDHGSGVYTRYAHLSSFAPGVVVGAKLSQGQQIGLMGNTAAYRIPVHLHYEVLTGDYANPKASFGLKPVNPYSFPKAG